VKGEVHIMDTEDGTVIVFVKERVTYGMVKDRIDIARVIGGIVIAGVIGDIVIAGVIGDIVIAGVISGQNTFSQPSIPTTDVRYHSSSLPFAPSGLELQTSHPFFLSLCQLPCLGFFLVGFLLLF